MTSREHVDVAVPFEDRDFRVRIHRGGTLEILDPEIQIEYDQAFAAMGGEKTPALQLLGRWEGWPSKVLATSLVNHNTLLRLAVDYCRRVMPIYYKTFPSDDRPRKILRNLMEASRRKDIPEEATAMTAITASKVARDAATNSPRGVHAAEVVGRAINHAAHSAYGYAVEGHDLCSVADAAAAAVGHDEAKAAPGLLNWQTQEFEDILKREGAWQIRRFIDVVSAVQEKRRIPKLGDTR